jgi:DNA-directed RNA polymerase specialized sigma subunit
MEIFEELNGIYNELRSHGVVRTKKELAEILGVSDKGIIKAMKGDPQYATPSLRTKMLRFRDEKLGPSEPPQPDAKEAALDRLLANMNDAHAIAMKTLEQNDRLIALLEMEARMRTGFAPEIAEGKNARSAEE